MAAVVGVLMAGTGCGLGGPSVVAVTPNTVTVQAALVRSLEPGDTWALPGRVRADQHALLTAATSGQVQRVDVREGQGLAEGDLLLALDDGLARARLDAARGAVDLARGQFASAEGDHADASAAGMATRGASRRMDGARLAIGARRAEVEVAAVQLVQHELRAPFEGLAARVLVQVGDGVLVGDPLIEWVALDPVQVVLDGPAPLLDSLQTLDTVAITQVGGNDVVLGDIKAVVPVVDERSDTVRVRVSPNEPRGWLVPGARVSAQVELNAVTAGVVVPEGAVVRGAMGPRVVRIADGRAVQVPVVVVATQEDADLVVSSDLRVGDEVAVRGHHTLTTGRLVSVD